MMTGGEHVSVLLVEAVEGLAIQPGGIYIDATFGRGGHSAAILNQLGPDGRLLAFDKDPQAIAAASQPPFADPRFEIVQASFAALANEIEKRNWTGKVDGILLDLGVSSPQLDQAERGFSFIKEGPLDMRMDPSSGIDAATWLNQAEAEEIANVLWEYGEERCSRRIAKAIVARRQTQPLSTTTELAELIAAVMPRRREIKKHPATRSFQAIRIFINDELTDLKHCLAQCITVLSVAGRLSVISFHSLEDRIVKRFIQRESHGDPIPPGLPIKEADIQRRLRKVGGMIKPSAAELAVNPRARSACLRIAEKLG